MCTTTPIATNNDEAPEKASLLVRLGGGETLKVAVEEFYYKLLCDDDLLEFFDGVDTDLLKAHQHSFLSLVFTMRLTSENLTRVTAKVTKAHERLWPMGLNERHFDLVVSHLVHTLLELGVPQDLVDEVVSIVGPLRGIFETNAVQKVETREKKAPVVVVGIKPQNTHATEDVSSSSYTSSSSNAASQRAEKAVPKKKKEKKSLLARLGFSKLSF